MRLTYLDGKEIDLDNIDVMEVRKMHCEAMARIIHALPTNHRMLGNIIMTGQAMELLATKITVDRRKLKKKVRAVEDGPTIYGAPKDRPKWVPAHANCGNCAERGRLECDDNKDEYWCKDWTAEPEGIEEGSCPECGEPVKDGKCTACIWVVKQTPLFEPITKYYNDSHLGFEVKDCPSCLCFAKGWFCCHLRWNGLQKAILDHTKIPGWCPLPDGKPAPAQKEEPKPYDKPCDYSKDGRCEVSGCECTFGTAPAHQLMCRLYKNGQEPMTPSIYRAFYNSVHQTKDPQEIR